MRKNGIDKEMKQIEGGVCAPKGFSANGIHCGIRKNKKKKDLALIVCDRRAATACVYTKNLVKGAPILVTQKHVADGYSRAVIVNSGNANTCNADGIEIAEGMCALVEKHCGIPAGDVVVASTGVIGQKLSLEPIAAGMENLVGGLGNASENNVFAAEAIMTTDTVSKQLAYEFRLGDVTCKIGAICKGVGMLCPNMATMLCVVLTDAMLDQKLWQEMFSRSVNLTFNRVSVDGDTSTNDTILGLANGASGVTLTADDAAVLEKELTDILKVTAHMLVKDGEGATKVLRITVTGADSDRDAEQVARTVGNSQLVKTAMYGMDANWGRIIAAVGRAGVPMKPEDVSVSLCGVELFRNGQPLGGDFDAALEAPLKERLIPVDISVGVGPGTFTLETADLSVGYVKLNSDYRS